MAMSELGAFLQRHREELGATLDDLEAQTRIRRKYLEAMESGEWDVLPPGVYARGLLRNYARAIGVSEAGVLRMYVKERPGEARLPEPQLISQPLIAEPRFNFEMLLAAGLLVVAIVLFAWTVGTRFLPGGQVAGADPPAGTPTPRALAVSNPTRRATVSSSSRVSAPTSPVRTVRPLATSTPTASPTAFQGLVMEVKATSDAWVLVQTDGSEAFSGFLRQGEARSWQAHSSLRLRTGNAGGTQITLNGQTLAVLGGNGLVEEREWHLLPDGNIEQSG